MCLQVFQGFQKTYIMEILVKSKIPIRTLLGNTGYFKISIDFYSGRVISSRGGKFHQNRAAGLDTKYVALTFANEEKIPGPDIVYKMQRSQPSVAIGRHEYKCQLLRVELPINGTIVFDDETEFSTFAIGSNIHFSTRERLSEHDR